MKRVLIIEDDVVVNSIYRRKYELSGFDVENAMDGDSGLVKLVEFKPDIVQLDLQLPKKSGIDVIKEIRAKAEFKSMPILVLSSFYKHDMVKEAWRAGATKCVTKIECTPIIALEVIQQLLAAKDSEPPSPPPAYPNQNVGHPAASFPQPQAPYPAAYPTGFPQVPGTAPSPYYPTAPMSVVEPAAEAPATPSLDVREEFLSRVPEIQAGLRDRANALIRAKGVTALLPQLREFYESCHAVANLAATTGFVRVSHLADALEGLLKELHAKLARVTASALRTVAHAADTLIDLCQEAQEGAAGTPQSGLILAVDDEPISRRVLANALSKASLKTISLDDPHLALRVLNENPFDLIFLDADMPGMNGFELCKQLRGLPGNKTTPVVFVTSLNDFDSRAQSILAGGNDLIAKPFLMIELAVKALTYLMKPKVRAQKSAGQLTGALAERAEVAVQRGRY